MKKITFLMTTSGYYPSINTGSGSNNYINLLATSLAQRGHDVHIMHVLDASRHGVHLPSSADWDNAISKWKKQYPNIFVHTIRSPIGLVEPLIAYIFHSPYINRQFRNMIQEIRPDVVHHQDFSFLGYDILRKQGHYLSIYTAHDYRLICQTARLLKNGKVPCEMKKNCFLCGFRSRKPPRLGRFRNDFKTAIGDIDVILSFSKPVKQRLGLELGNRIELVPQIMPTPPRKIKSSGYSNYFLFAGGLSEGKGLAALLKLFSEYSNQISAKLIITGGGKVAEAENLVRKYDLQDKVIFLGWVDREMLWALYRDALAVIVPSTQIDPAPVVVLEAMSVGTPVIGSDRGGIPEMVGKLDKELIFPADNLNKLGEIIMNFNKEKYPPDLVKQVCQKWFSLDNYISQYLDIIESLLKSQN